ncbi:MAG: two-component regulator propeller domain-containing protein [Ferruginibacter sp.]
MKKKQEESLLPINKNFKPPVIIKAGNPYIVNLDTCPTPQTIIVPIKDSMFFTMKTPYWERQLKMVPPKIHPADFFVTMPKFGNEQGLQAHSVLSSIQDKKGNLWFGTDGGGVTRFDGKSAVTFTGLGCNNVRAILEDREGNIWFGMGGCGLVKYDGTGITNYTTKEGLADNEVLSLAQDSKGNIWIGTYAFGVSRFDGKTFKNYNIASGLANNQVFGIAEDKQGNIWFGTDGGASCYNGESFTNLSESDGLINNYIKTVICDSKGILWFGTARGLSRYKSKLFTNFTIENGLVNNYVACITEVKKGNFWIGTQGGVSRFDGESFQNFTTKQGLENNNVRTITEDSKGNMWIGAAGGGVVRYEGAAVTSFSTEQGMFYNHLRSIFEDINGKLWLGPSIALAGVFCYDEKSFTQFSFYQGFMQGTVNAIFQDRNKNIWFCTDRGFSRYDGKAFTNYNIFHGLRTSNINCGLEDSTGKLWFGVGGGGISIFDGKTLSNMTTAQGLPSDKVTAIVDDAEGCFWIATYGGGLSCYDGKFFMNFDTAQGMADNYIKCMKKDSKGNIWIGGGNGGVSILRIDVLKKIRKGIGVSGNLFEKFSTSEGLANNVVYDLVEDKLGNIFIGTNFGYTVIKGGISPGRIIQRDDLEYYNQKTGYPINDLNTGAMYVDSKGIVWGGTGHDLVRFDYSAVRKSKLSPYVTIQGIKVNNDKPGWYNIQLNKKVQDSAFNQEILSAIGIEENINYDASKSQAFRDSMYQKFADVKFDSIARFNPVPINLVLPHSHNNITIEFAAIEPAKPEFVKYQYILEGYDKDWSPVTGQAFASFGNIREGSYTFKVKASSPDGVWSQPVEYTFKVLAPWFRTWWAYTAYAILFFQLAYFIYKNRITSLERKQSLQLQTVIATQEEERKRISRDLHDDVGTKLSALKLFLSSLKANVQKQQYPQADQLATNSEELINETIKDVREMLLNLSPGILEEFGYTSAIEALINKINQAGTIHFQLSVFGIKGKLRKEYELALYRISQELINNTLKHSNAKNVMLQLGYRNEKIIIMIEDDGIGFDAQQHKDGYGLRNLEARTKLLNGTINIDSQLGKGTSVLIEVPYKFT